MYALNKYPSSFYLNRDKEDACFITGEYFVGHQHELSLFETSSYLTDSQSKSIYRYVVYYLKYFSVLQRIPQRIFKTRQKEYTI